MRHPVIAILLMIAAASFASAETVRLLESDRASCETLYDVLDSAQDSIVLQSPYFIPSDRLGRILRRAADRGVSICILAKRSPFSVAPGGVVAQKLGDLRTLLFDARSVEASASLAFRLVERS